MELHELLEQVNSKKSFFTFLSALLEDKRDEERKEKLHPSSPYGPGANGWENGSLTDFLESMEGYLEDSEDISEEPHWHSFALLLYMGKIYE